MKTIHPLNIALSLLCLFIMVSGADAQTRLPGPEKEGDERLVTPLINAGIALNEASLINALKNPDSNLAARAAGALARFPKTKRIVRALESAIADAGEIVVLRAGYSLLALGERDWVPIAVQRLPGMRNPILQVQFAGVLARAGNTAGWPIVTLRVIDESFAPIVLADIDHFDRKTAPNGRTINVSEELEKLSPRASEGSRKLIQEKLTQLKTKGR